MKKVDDCRECANWIPGPLTHRLGDDERLLVGGECTKRLRGVEFYPPPVNFDTCSSFESCSAHEKAERLALWEEVE